MAEEQTVEELEKQIEEYKSQLEIVNAALKEEPDSEEFSGVRKSLLDVLKITHDLLFLKRETQDTPKYEDIQEIATKRGVYIGMQCEALWGDGKWYKAVVSNMSEYGFGVTFSEYNTTEVVPPESVRPRKKIDVVVLESGQPPKASTGSSIVVTSKGELVVPNSLKILPTDSEAVRKTKKKKTKTPKITIPSKKSGGRAKH